MTGATRHYRLTTGGLPAEAVVALLAELDFDAFEEGEHHVDAYLPEARHGGAFAKTVEALAAAYGLTATTAVLPEENWNARWEAGFAPAEVGDFLRVRAPFHAPAPGFAIELEVVPEMSFGTGHHETTHLMAELLRERPPAGASVFDFGTGTGILALVAARLGARRIVATDHDARCVRSARANAERNGVTLDYIGHGDVDVMPDETFGLILANIQRGVLVRAMPALAKRLGRGGELWLSGVLAGDLAPVDEAAAARGLTRVERRRRGRWLACRYRAA